MTAIIAFVGGAIFAATTILIALRLRARDSSLTRLPEFAEMKSVIDQLRLDSTGGMTKLETLIGGMLHSQESVVRHTNELSAAFNKPGVRGNWGEQTLRRVIESSGLVQHVDFDVQRHVRKSADQAGVRVDVVIKLPGGRIIPIDSKMPFDAFHSAQAAEDERTRESLLEAHVKQVKSTIDALSKKTYWDAFATTPEVVIMFIGSEAVYRAAVERDPHLITTAAQKQVMLATPATLLPMLQVIAIAWREQTFSENVQTVLRLAKRLADQTRVLSGHISDVGRNLNTTVTAHNKAARSFESRMLATAREIQALGIDVQLPEEITTPETLARIPAVEAS